MSISKTLLLSASALMALTAAPALAQQATVTTKTTTAVAPTVDGGVVYETHSVTKPTDTVVASGEARRPVVFYYYDTKAGEIIAASTMTEEIFNIWDKDRNGYVSPQEYYNNEMVVYQPVETETKVFSDVDADGRLELTLEEYTMRLEQVPDYTVINTDAKTGLTVQEFVGAGFQETDDDDNNQVSYGELVEAFYGQPRMASEQERYNN